MNISILKKIVEKIDLSDSVFAEITEHPIYNRDVLLISMVSSDHVKCYTLMIEDIEDIKNIDSMEYLTEYTIDYNNILNGEIKIINKMDGKSCLRLYRDEIRDKDHTTFSVSISELKKIYNLMKIGKTLGTETIGLWCDNQDLKIRNTSDDNDDFDITLYMPWHGYIHFNTTHEHIHELIKFIDIIRKEEGISTKEDIVFKQRIRDNKVDDKYLLGVEIYDIATVIIAPRMPEDRAFEPLEVPDNGTHIYHFMRGDAE